MHHANVLYGSHAWSLEEIPEGERVVSQDVRISRYTAMTIADARTLIRDVILLPVERTHKTYILLCDTILKEAQNTLLKLFEDPPEHVRFFLSIPSETLLLPTLRSRLFVYKRELSEYSQDEFLNFRTLSVAERLTVIAEKIKEEDTLWLTSCIEGAVLYARTTKNPVHLRRALTIESYSHAQGASRKMLLEYIAVSF